MKKSFVNSRVSPFSERQRKRYIMYLPEKTDLYGETKALTHKIMVLMVHGNCKIFLPVISLFRYALMAYVFFNSTHLTTSVNPEFKVNSKYINQSSFIRKKQLSLWLSSDKKKVIQWQSRESHLANTVNKGSLPVWEARPEGGVGVQEVRTVEVGGAIGQVEPAGIVVLVLGLEARGRGQEGAMGTKPRGPENRLVG